MGVNIICHSIILQHYENAYFYTKIKIITSLIWRIILEYEGALYKVEVEIN